MRILVLGAHTMLGDRLRLGIEMQNLRDSAAQVGEVLAR